MNPPGPGGFGHQGNSMLPPSFICPACLQKRNHSLPTRRWPPKSRKTLNYFAARREYMKYDEYLAAGYPIGSGVVEGACRHLVKDRMEQTGMRWRIAGAQAILNLRAIYLNDDWEAFHADRIRTEQRKLYPYKNRMVAILNCAA